MNTGNISPSTLFQEIHSYIKGSPTAMDNPSGFLSRDEYLRLPSKMAPNFRGLGQSETKDDLSADQTGSRNAVYDMFEMYEDMKRKRHAYDNCDLVHHVWNGLKEEGYRGTHIDSVFVDEAQVVCLPPGARLFRSVELTLTRVGLRFAGLHSS